MNEVLCLGISHKTAPVALRERVAMGDIEAERFLRAAVASPAVAEAAVISTCNRTEIYATSHDPVAAESAVLGLLAARAGIRPTELADAIYSPRNCDAARQLYRVTAGLESMIVGEAEVQGQVKRAFELAQSAGATGPMLNRLFAAALQTGKRVRTETAIGAGGASVPSVAVDLARDLLGDLSERHVAIIGAGETSELTARALREHGDGIVEQVLAENEGRWQGASEADLKRIEALARSVMNRLLQEPTQKLRALKRRLGGEEVMIGRSAAPTV